MTFDAVELVDGTSARCGSVALSSGNNQDPAITPSMVGTGQSGIHTEIYDGSLQPLSLTAHPSTKASIAHYARQVPLMTK